MNTPSVVALCLLAGVLGGAAAPVWSILRTRRVRSRPTPPAAPEPTPDRDVAWLVAGMLAEAAHPPDGMARADAAAKRPGDEATLRYCLAYLLWLAAAPGSAVPAKAQELADYTALAAAWKLPTAEKP